MHPFQLVSTAWPGVSWLWVLGCFGNYLNLLPTCHHPRSDCWPIGFGPGSLLAYISLVWIGLVWVAVCFWFFPFFSFGFGFHLLTSRRTKFFRNFHITPPRRRSRGERDWQFSRWFSIALRFFAYQDRVICSSRKARKQPGNKKRMITLAYASFNGVGFVVKRTGSRWLAGQELLMERPGGAGSRPSKAGHPTPTGLDWEGTHQLGIQLYHLPTKYLQLVPLNLSCDPRARFFFFFFFFFFLLATRPVGPSLTTYVASYQAASALGKIVELQISRAVLPFLQSIAYFSPSAPHWPLPSCVAIIIVIHMAAWSCPKLTWPGHDHGGSRRRKIKKTKLWPTPTQTETQSESRYKFYWRIYLHYF